MTIRRPRRCRCLLCDTSSTRTTEPKLEVLYDRTVLQDSHRLHGSRARCTFRLVVQYNAVHARQLVLLHRTFTYGGAQRRSIACRICTHAPPRSQHSHKSNGRRGTRPYAGKLPIAHLLQRMTPLRYSGMYSTKLLHHLRYAQLICVVKARRIQTEHALACMCSLSCLRPRLPDDVWRACVWGYLLER